jgi:hypothetical protein
MAMVDLDYDADAQDLAAVTTLTRPRHLAKLTDEPIRRYELRLPGLSDPAPRTAAHAVHRDESSCRHVDNSPRAVPSGGISRSTPGERIGAPIPCGT